MATTVPEARADDVAVQQVASNLDALIRRLQGDKKPSEHLANNPREAMADAGISLDKDALEAYIRTDPERFESATDELFQLVDSDFLIAMAEPCCAT